MDEAISEYNFIHIIFVGQHLVLIKVLCSSSSSFQPFEVDWLLQSFPPWSMWPALHPAAYFRSSVVLFAVPWVPYLIIFRAIIQIIVFMPISTFFMTMTNIPTMNLLYLFVNTLSPQSFEFFVSYKISNTVDLRIYSRYWRRPLN